jgi:hypothetical protein
MILLLSHDIMITPYLLRITPYHTIDCTLPIMTAECCACMAYSYSLYEYFYAFYAFYITYT